MCVIGSDAYVRLSNCFSRLWPQFNDLLMPFTVCGWCQPNSRYKVRITRQLFSEEIQWPRNRKFGWALQSGQMTPLPPSSQMHRGMAAYRRRNPPHLHWTRVGSLTIIRSSMCIASSVVRIPPPPPIIVAVALLPACLAIATLKIEPSRLTYSLARVLNRPDCAE